MLIIGYYLTPQLFALLRHAIGPLYYTTMVLGLWESEKHLLVTTHEMLFAGALQMESLGAYAKQATGEKFLITPQA